MAVPLRVLIVEDVESHAESVLAELKRGDYALTTERVWTEEGLQTALKQGGWTVVLCAFVLPGFSGMDALAMVQQSGCGVPFIFVSGQMDEDAAVAALRGGAADYVRKSNLVRLRPTIERALREAEERRAQERLRQEAAARARQQAELAEFGQWALAGRALDALLVGTAERVAEALDVEFCEVLELTPGEGALWLRAGAGWQPGCVGNIRLAATNESQAGATWRGGVPIMVENWGTESRFQPSALLREHSVASGLTVPIRLRNRVFGVLGAHSARPRELTSSDAHFLQAIANVLATAIERKLAEDALRESDERFRLLVDEVKGYSIITLDPEACVLTWNHGAEILFGHMAAEMIGQHVARMYPPGDVELGKPELDLRLAEEMGQFEDEDWRMQKGGTEFWANSVITALRRTDGTLRGYGVVTRDMTERRLAHEALRLNEEKFRSLVNHIPDAVWTLNAAGEALFMSGNAERIYGFTVDELKAQGAAMGLGRVHADDTARVREAWQALFERQQRFEVECRYERKDGRQAWLLFRASAIYEKDGQLVADGITSDITERKRAEDALRESEARFQMVSRATNDVVWDWNLETNLLWWNPSFLTQFGYAAEEVEPSIESWTRRLHPAEATRVSEKIHAAIERGDQLWSDEYRFRRQDGSYAFIYDRGFVIRSAEGRPLRMIGAMQDISERRRAEGQIRSQARLLDLAGDAIIVRNLKHEVLYWNHGAEHIYGWKAEEARGRRVTELVMKDTKPFEAAQAELLAKGDWSGELRQFTRDGREVTVNSRWTLVRDDEGQPTSVLVLNTDITEKKRLESQFLRAQRMESIGTLAGGVAHDLNNILAPIMMSAPLLRMDSLPPEDFERLLDTIETNTQRGSDIVKQLLAFGRGIEGERVVVQPRHIIKEMVKIARETFPKNITITSEVAENLWPIMGDPTHTHQVLLNLCINARDAMPHGGTLKVIAENVQLDEHYAVQDPDAKQGPFVSIRVSDTGTGIPKEIMDKIFEPFFTTKEIGKGTGLGLATVMGIIKNYGGLVHVYSEPGKGSVFNVLLPAAPNATSAADEANREPLPMGRGEGILMVDDESGIIKATCKLLERHNYRVFPATDGAEALTVFSRHRGTIRLVLTDMMMPVMDGLALTRVIKRMDGDVKIIASSGLQPDARWDELRALGVNTFLIKPYTAEKLLRTLRDLLADEPASRT
ncbi:MAG: PAS domain S-box protein [Verrucomicrobia bacterium]|nr:PAS domain S-box protein [Verrucomicrobiota bacterium]